MMRKSMEYVYAVHKERSFSRAAKKLFVSQPALSATVKKLEEEIGLPLFDRSTSPVSLTLAGEYYIHAIEQIMQVEQVLDEQLDSLRSKTSGSLTVGGAAFFCACMLPSLIQRFKQENPRYEVTLVEGGAVQALERQLLAGELDLFIDAKNPWNSALGSIDWIEESLVLAVPASFEINKRLEAYRLSFDQIRDESYLDEAVPAVALEEFANEPFVLLKKGADLYSRAMRLCRDAGFTPRCDMYLDQMLTAYYVAKWGSGVTFIRSSITKYAEPTGKLCFYKLAGEQTRRSIAIHYKRSAALSPAAKQFIRFLMENR